MIRDSLSRREVHAGSGHWSQDGAVQVLGFSEPVESLFVSWPGGRSQRVDINSGSSEVTVRFREAH